QRPPEKNPCWINFRLKKIKVKVTYTPGITDICEKETELKAKFFICFFEKTNFSFYRNLRHLFIALSLPREQLSAVFRIKMKPVYDYMDYRCFLKERFSSLKARNPLFSYRSFSRLAGTKSSGFLKLIIDGRRNLGDDGIMMVARGFKLND